MSFFVPSTATGKTWQVYATKTTTGYVIGGAIEGERDGEVFSFELLGSRSLRMTTQAKRATPKANAAAIRLALSELVERGYVTAQDAASVPV
jgi:hypothetical protein